MGPMIIVAGEALIDILVLPDGDLRATLGGGPFNTARTIARLGGSVAYLGCLARDRFGTQLRDALTADGVDLSLASTTDLPSTLAVAELDADGAATYHFHTLGTSAPSLDASAVSAALATDPAAIHVGTLGLVLEPIASALAAGVARSAGDMIVMLDANCRASAIDDRATYLARLEGVVRRADIVKLSVDDVAYISPGAEPIEAAQRFAGDRSVVLLTDGGRPVIVLGTAGRLDVPVPAVPVIDTVGAGDAFGGAFLARWIEQDLGREALADPALVREAVVLAIEVADATCQRPGANPPRRDELRWPTP
jgi:fructokinase